MRLNVLPLLLPIFCLVTALAGRATAAPLLQLYIEGADYNQSTDSWEISPAGSSSGTPFRLWVIGNISGPGGKGTIEDVKLSAAYDESVGDVVISLTPSQAGGLDVGEFQGFTDPSVPNALVYLQGPEGTEGTTPLLSDGSPLPPHGEYGPGRVWQEFAVGDLGTADSPAGDFIDTFPEPGDPDSFQINVYEVSVTGDFSEHPFTIHWDVYNHVTAGNHAKYTFAPFSHDSDADTTIIPEPASGSLLAIGLLACLGVHRLRRRDAA